MSAASDVNTVHLRPRDGSNFRLNPSPIRDVRFDSGANSVYCQESPAGFSYFIKISAGFYRATGRPAFMHVRGFMRRSEHAISIEIKA